MGVHPRRRRVDHAAAAGGADPKIAAEDRCEENGFYVNRYFIFLGKRIRHCGYYPSWNIRFFRRGKAVYEQRDVHEHMLVDGKVGFLKHDMEHDDRRGIEYYIAKHNHYSTLEARAMYRTLLGQQPGDRRRRSGATRSSGGAGSSTASGRGCPPRWLFRFIYMYLMRRRVSSTAWSACNSACS